MYFLSHKHLSCFPFQLSDDICKAPSVSSGQVILFEIFYCPTQPDQQRDSNNDYNLHVTA